MARSTNSIAILLVVGLIAGTGCISTPEGGVSVTNRWSSFNVHGAAPSAQQTIRIQAYDFYDERFENVATTSSSSSPWVQTTDGYRMYNWGKSVSLTSRYWQRGKTGYRARIRVDGLYGVVLDSACANALSTSTLSQLIDTCEPSLDNELKVFTSDFTVCDEGCGALKADDSCPYGHPSCNPCVKNAVTSLTTKLRSRGDIMGFHPDGLPNLSVDEHIQSFQRMPSIPFTGLDGRIGVIDPDYDNDTDGAHLGIINFASRSTGRGRWRSNRLKKGVDTWADDNPPPTSDRVIRAVRIHDPPEFRHPGGMQQIGRYLLVPLEDPVSGNSTDHAKVVLFDLKDPLNPQLVWEHELAGDEGDGAAAAIIRLVDGRYLMAVAGRHTDFVDFYTSTTLDIESPQWAPSFFRLNTNQCGPGQPVGLCWNKYQSFNLVAECGTQDMFLFAGDRNKDGPLRSQKNFVQVFQFNIAGSSVDSTFMGHRDVFCSTPGDSQCDLDGGFGTYIDDDNQLYVYGTDKSDAGPNGTVRMMEFRPVPHTNQCTSSSHGWVELYEHDNFGGRSVMLDYNDRAKRELNDFRDLDDFNDKADSVRWCVPFGRNFIIYRSFDAQGPSFLLDGTGQVEELDDLDDFSFSDGSNLGDATTSAKWD